MTGLVVLAAVLFVSEAMEVPDPERLARRRGLLSGPTLWHEEGAQTTVVVTGYEKPVHGRVLYLNGRHQANDSAAMVFIHRRIGLLPAVLHAHPRQALVVGLGGGATAGGLSQFPGLAVDVVELSGEVVRGAAFFSHVNFDVLNRSNVTTRVDDGRNHLLRTTKRYDVITADAILPHHAGSNNLNSVEYFRLVRDRLAPDGVALHWNGGTTEAEYQMILRAFVEAFPLATLWGDGTLMVGVKEPLTVPRAPRGGAARRTCRPAGAGPHEYPDVRSPRADVPREPRRYSGVPSRRWTRPQRRQAGPRVLRFTAQGRARPQQDWPDRGWPRRPVE